MFIFVLQILTMSVTSQPCIPFSEMVKELSVWNYLEWWSWRVQGCLAHLVVWHLGPVIHQKMNVHKLPVVSVGQLVCIPTDGYTVQLPLVEFGVGKPAVKKGKKQLMFFKNLSNLSRLLRILTTYKNMVAFVKVTF